MAEIVALLMERLRDAQIRLNEPMKLHTTFKVGGPADIFVLPSTAGELAYIISCCAAQSIPCFILGNGSNILVKDKGMRGVVISTKELLNCRAEGGNKIFAGAGVSLSDFADFALAQSLTGFEFACGIPGSIGGAVFMNAGAYDGEMKDVFDSAEVITKNAEIKTLTLDEMDFAYRKSIVQKEKMIVTGATFQLAKGNPSEIKAKMDDLNAKRKEKQPLDMPSAGSTFKRPPGRFAGKLIMDSGLRGYVMGGAQVSELHCGFVVNRGNATANDVMNLINHIRETVYEKYGVMLEPEVRILGE